MPGETIRLVDSQGVIRDVPVEAAASALDAGWTIPTHGQELGRVAEQAREEEYGGAVGATKATLAGAGRGLTLGLTDVAARAIGGEDAAIALEGYRDENPGLSIGGEIAGALAPIVLSGGTYAPAALASAAGRGAARAAGAGLRGAIVGGATEGAIFGVGTGVSELALSRDPLTAERAASVIGSNALFGGATGGALTGAGNLVEKGLLRAKGVLDAKIAERAARDVVPEDLAGLDHKGLRLAEESERASIEAERVVQRQGIADDLGAFQREQKDQKLWLATQQADEAVPPATPAPVDTPPAGTGDPQSVPLMVTRKMKSDLEGLGYTPEAIAEMKPAEAWEAIARGTKPNEKSHSRFEPLSDDEFEEARLAFKQGLDGDQKYYVRRYIGESYRHLNDKLRAGSTTEEELRLAMDSLLDAHPASRDMRVYRGLSGERSHDLFSKMDPGDRFVDRGFISTSAEFDSAKRGTVTFEIDVPKGYPAAPIGGQSAESEVLLRRDTMFEIVSKSDTPDGVVIHVRVVPDSPQRAPTAPIETDIPGATVEVRKKPQVPDPPAPPSASAPPPLPKIEGIAALGKRTLVADRAIDRLLDNPKMFARKPKATLEAALGHLEKQEAAWEGILAKSDALRVAYAADTSGQRLAALEGIPAALERNRALQDRITAVLSEPSSPRLTSIGDAREALKLPRPEPGIMQRVAQGATFGTATAAIGAIPVVGQIPGLAHLLGAKVSDAVTGLVFGRMGKAIPEVATRTAAAVDAFARGAKTATKYAPVLASKTLAAYRYGRPDDSEPTDLPGLYKRRTEEVKRLTEYDETGTPRLRFSVRRQVAEMLKPVAMLDPVAADRLETNIARRIEYLSSKIPRRPDFGTPQIGPDTWQPSDMEIRSWARTVAAVEDPHGVEERAIHGALTPEDVEAYWAVYPERAQDFKQQIMLGLSNGSIASLPFERKQALWMLVGQPVDPSQHPKVVARLQGQFPNEPGSSGGAQPPRAQPQFGSIKKTPANHRTPAQERAQ